MGHLHQNGHAYGHQHQNAVIGVTSITVLLGVHLTVNDEELYHNLYQNVGVHLCCLSCHSGCTDACQGTLQEHITGHLADHLIVMHIINHHPGAEGYALLHNSQLRTFNFVSQNGLLAFIHSRNGDL